ncbi:hypothetical protein CH063_10047 [Colletotrichum higginsianum]|uniref:Uncharacterized protein n=1 Tax=Colletotrichum higginsianum (strain IMI 349063) TaxID=759273 RepID=H1VFY0_COLHI|nr:hypothetical protein CH063_10047 [Colletotrichum higginsianum]
MVLSAMYGSTPSPASSPSRSTRSISENKSASNWAPKNVKLPGAEIKLNSSTRNHNSYRLSNRP